MSRERASEPYAFIRNAKGRADFQDAFLNDDSKNERIFLIENVLWKYTQDARKDSLASHFLPDVNIQTTERNREKYTEREEKNGRSERERAGRRNV